MTGLYLTILTGHRLALLRRSVESLCAAAPCVRRAHAVAYVNGHDPETVAYLRGLAWVRVVVGDKPTPEPIGAAVSRLASMVPAGCDYHLHLEDDWECTATDDAWLLDAADILRCDPLIGQVRLRLASEPVMARHMVTGEPMEWSRRWCDRCEYMASGLHFTYNPSLMRIGDLGTVHPADHEMTAARRYMARWRWVAQHVPGAFRHIGGEASLRASLGR